MRSRRWAVAALLAAVALPAYGADDKPKKKKVEKKPPQSVYDFTVVDIDGKKVPLSRFKDQVLMIVNVASQ